MVGNNDANKPAEEQRYDHGKPNAERLAAIARRLIALVTRNVTRPVTAAIAFPDRVIYGSENSAGYDQWVAVRDRGAAEEGNPINDETPHWNWTASDFLEIVYYANRSSVEREIGE